MYPGFLKKFKDLPSDIKYVGISAFFSFDRIIIKAEFESPQLNKIRKYLIATNPLIRAYYDEFKKNFEKKKKLKDKFSNIYVKDKSYHKVPKGWIHVTLLIVKPNISEKEFNNIIKVADTTFKLNKDTNLSLKEIGINLKNNFHKIL